MAEHGLPGSDSDIKESSGRAWATRYDSDIEGSCGRAWATR